MGLANWNWRVVHQFVADRFGISLNRSSCLNYLHRLGFAFKRPKKRLLKADETKREAFVVEYVALAHGAKQSGGKIFFADEAHFRADAELRGKWVLRGEPALVDSSSPRYGEKASYYSAVCLETGEVEWMELEGNSNSETSACFLRQLGERHHGPLQVIWDNAPAHRGEAVREYLQTPGLGLMFSVNYFCRFRQLFLPVHPLFLTALPGHSGAVAGDVEFQDDRVVDHPVDGRRRGHRVGEDVLPLGEDQVGRDAQGPAFVAFGDEREEHLGLLGPLGQVPQVVQQQEVVVVELS